MLGWLETLVLGTPRGISISFPPQPHTPPSRVKVRSHNNQL
jgi:hypothetical protein